MKDDRRNADELLRTAWEHFPARSLTQLLAPDEGHIHLVDLSGNLFKTLCESGTQSPPPASLCREMIEEALRWGEPAYRWYDEEAAAVALPLTWNQFLLGGVVAALPFRETSSEAEQTDASRLRHVAARLREALVGANWLNEALMDARRERAERERLRAEAIHEAKQRGEGAWEASYAYWEPELFLAMRRRERTEARRILNRILLALYSLGREDMQRTRGFVLDLVTMMARTMADCGADPTETLGGGLDRLAELRAIEDEETLGRWVANVLERLIDAVERTSAPTGDFRMSLVLKYLREHCHEPLSRDEVAAKIGLSPAHFSRLFAESIGRSFTEELTHIRLEKAVRLLSKTDTPIKQIAEACGFADQGYFTRVFRRKFGRTPGAYAALSADRTRLPQTERISQ